LRGIAIDPRIDGTGLVDRIAGRGRGRRHRDNEGEPCYDRQENAPTIGSLVMNSTAPITWTGDKVFHLTSAGTQAGEPAVTP
jgi:hypothetical protein